MRLITLITTGGTIEKTYDEGSGELENRHSVVHRMLRRLRLTDTHINVIELMHKDSITLTNEDRRRIAETVHAVGGTVDLATETAGVVVLHGTDTLDRTGRWLHKAIWQPRVPIVLTGAMRPYEMTRTDALQNLTEAIFATGILTPGIYCVAHGQVLPFPNVRKDRSRSTFVATEPGELIESIDSVSETPDANTTSNAD
ncbi:MAG: asparaginase domain-containing protein [Planctomycetota bacterium]